MLKQQTWSIFFCESDKLLAGKAQDQAHGLGGRRAVGVSSLVSPIGLLCGGGLPRLRLKCCHVFGYTPVTISTSLILANSNLSSKFPIPEVSNSIYGSVPTMSIGCFAHESWAKPRSCFDPTLWSTCHLARDTPASYYILLPHFIRFIAQQIGSKTSTSFPLVNPAVWRLWPMFPLCDDST